MCLRPIRVCACDISCALEVCIVAMPKRQHLHTDSHTLRKIMQIYSQTHVRRHRAGQYTQLSALRRQGP